MDEDELRRELEDMVRDERERELEKMQDGRKAEDGGKTGPEAVPPSGGDKDAERAALPTPAAEKGEDEDKLRRERYEDAQLRQRQEAARAELERMRRAERVAAE